MMQFYSINSSLQHMKFSAKKQENQLKKLKEPLSIQEKEMERMREDAKRIQEGNILSGIDSKLTSGLNLSDDELEYLKKHNPEAYKEAVEVIRERKAYEKALKNCKSKEDVEKLHQNKLQSFAANVKSIEQNPNIPKIEKLKKMDAILKKLMAVENEHSKFTASSRYKNLPDSLDNKKKKDDNSPSKVDSEFVKKSLAIATRSRKLDNPIDSNVSNDLNISKPNTVSVEPSPPANPKLNVKV